MKGGEKQKEKETSKQKRDRGPKRKRRAETVVESAFSNAPWHQVNEV